MRCVVLLLALWSLFPAWAQFPLVRQLDWRTGHQRPRVHALTQDAQGLFWAASDRGLLMHDGDRAELLLALSGNTTTSLCAYRSGVALATEQGVVLACRTMRCDTLWYGDGATTIEHLLQDAEGSLWAFSPGRPPWRIALPEERIPEPSALPAHATANDAAPFPGGGVVVANDLGLWRLASTGAVEQYLDQENGAPDNLILSVGTAGGRVFAGTHNGHLISWEPLSGTVEILHHQRDVPVEHVATDGRHLWWSQGGRLYTLALGRQNERYHLPVGPGVVDLAVTRQGMAVWCTGTELVGIADPNVLHVPEHEGVDLRNISAVGVDANDRIWFATPAGVYHHASGMGHNGALVRVPLALDPRTPVVSMAADAHGGMWLASFGSGVMHVDGQGAVKRHDHGNSAINDNVLCIRTSEGTVWMGTIAGVYLLRNGLVKHVPAQGPGFVHDLLPLGADHAWAATDGSGLVRVGSDGSWQPMSRSASTLYAVMEGDDGVVYAMGPDGLLCSSKADVLHCSAVSALRSSAEMFAMVPMANARLLVASEGAFLVGQGEGNVLDLTAALGLQNVSAELNAWAKDGLGRVWFACSQGLFRLDADAFQQAVSPVALITSVQVGLEMMPNTEAFTTSHDRNDITIRFTAAHQPGVGDLRFQVRLVGWEEGARMTAEREARFPRLPPGTYRFQVRAFVGEGPPSDAPWTELALTVTPAWYMRTGVQVVGIVLVMLALVLLVRIREQRLRMRQHLSQERVRYELEALRSQVDPHFLFNSFNDLVDLIESDPVRAVEHVERLSTFFRRILMLRDKDLIPLAEELEMLETYFALERSRFGEALALDVALEQAFMQHRVVPLTLQLLVENAIKHNVIDPHRPMVVRVEIRDGQLVVSNPRRPRLSPPRSTRFGLASIVQRYKAFSDMPVQVDAADDRFTVKVPLIPPAS